MDFSVPSPCFLCLCGESSVCKFTTETQRTPRTHRGFQNAKELLFISPKTNFDVAKSHHVAIHDLPRFTIRDATAVYKSSICRSSVGDQQCSLLIHQQRGMNFRDACIVQRKLVISGASYIQTTATRLEHERHFTSAITH